VLLMILLLLSAAQGPGECELAVAKAQQRVAREARELQVDVSCVEQEAGHHNGGLRSVLLCLQGLRAAELAAQWHGSFCWTCQSPLRPSHARKNWFFGGTVIAPPAVSLDSEIRFEATRSSGPGGQHVNTTDSAVRATHVASGISVKVQSERSQHANKRLAVLLIQQRLQAVAQQAEAEQRQDRRQFHHAVERGNPVRTFRGMQFTPV
jgi:peptide chain release factor